MPAEDPKKGRTIPPLVIEFDERKGEPSRMQTSELKLINMLRTTTFTPLVLTVIFQLQGVASAELVFPAPDNPQATVVVYDSTDGDLWLDYGVVPGNWSGAYSFAAFESRTGLFLTDGIEAPFPNFSPLNRFDSHSILQSDFGGIASFRFDEILPAGLEGEFLAQELSSTVSCPADGCPIVGGLIVVPEPRPSLWIAIYTLCLIFRTRLTGLET